jgi:uncharacterized protein (DUF1015 family)
LTKIKPFKAIRPSRDKAYLVATRPYYAYKKHVLEAKLETNPYTYLHVINPEFHAGDMTEPHSNERYLKSRKKLEEFIAEGIFIKDEEPTLYVYRQTINNHAFLGIIGGASVEQYNNGHIKKHEATITSREKHFSDYLRVVECNAEPVLLFHEEHKKLNALLQDITQERPEYEFSTTEKIKHEVWLISDLLNLTKIQSYYSQINEIYIADGHHRCASASRYSEEVHANLNGIRGHFLAYFISESNMEIFDYNRLVHDLNGLDTATFLTKLREIFRVTPIYAIEKHQRQQEHILLYIENTWWNIEVPFSMIDKSDVVNSLDTAILTNELLFPLLEIEDLKTDERISFIHGRKGLEGIEEKVNDGFAVCGFALSPVTVEQLKAVADNDKIMPPKSTWIEPKLRSGLTMYPLNHG